MRNTIKHIGFIILCLNFSVLMAQDLSWQAVPTNNEQTIFFSSLNEVYVGNDTLQQGDIIGAFYRQAGNYYCGGTLEYNGHSDSMEMIIYGADGIDPGFATGDTVHFLIYKKKPGCIYDEINVYYDNYSYGKTAIFEDGQSLKVNHLYANPHHVSYRDGEFCHSDGVIQPFGYQGVFEMTFHADSTLKLNESTGAVNLKKSKSGLHVIDINTAVCLTTYQTQVYIMPDADLIKMTDTVKCTYDTINIQGVSDTIPLAWSTADTATSLNVWKEGMYYASMVTPEGCYVMDTVEIKNEQIAPVIPQIEKQCFATSVSLPDDQYSYSWSNGLTGLQNDISETSNLVITKESPKGCQRKDTFNISVNPLDVADVLLKDAVANCNGVGFVETGIKNIKGGTPPYKVCLTNAKDVLKVDADRAEIPIGDYKISVIDSNNCTVQIDDTLHVTKNPNCAYPIITPDGDGIDDNLYIEQQGSAVIYDRYGNVVKSQFQVPAYWDGKDDAGHFLPLGSYMIVINNNDFINITVIR